MKTNTLTYNPEEEEEARNRWYLKNRDDFILKIVKKFADLSLSKKILDAGCGTGGVISKFSNCDLIVGNDMNFESLKWGKKTNRIINGIQASITNLPFRDNEFDISISSEVLEHVDNDQAALEELCRVTKSRIIFTVPAHNYLWTNSDDILLHKRRYSKSELLALVKKSGMHIVKLKPYGLIPALLVMLYKIFFHSGNKINNTIEDEELPLASRFNIPRPIEKMLGGLFFFDLWLSSKGLILWGHSWWVCIERRTRMN